MFRKYGLALLAFAGLMFAVRMVILGNRPQPTAAPVAQPAVAPYEHFVAGAGLVEANTENIAIGPHVSGVVARIHAKVGDQVEMGMPLFTIDEREHTAELAVAEKELRVAAARVERLKAEPRPELLPVKEALTRELEAQAQEVEYRLDLRMKMEDKRALSQEEIGSQRFEAKAARARHQGAEAELALLRAGTWQLELEVAVQEEERAAAKVAQARTIVDLHTVRSPITGSVLQVKIRAGEYAAPGGNALMLLGGVKPLHVRVDVDENDAWRIRQDAKAEAAVRGNAEIKTPLTFVRFEPYILPKKSLTGDSTERVDTRVLQVVFRVDKADLPLYVGQQMDVFIEAEERR